MDRVAGDDERGSRDKREGEKFLHSGMVRPELKGVQPYHPPVPGEPPEGDVQRSTHSNNGKDRISSLQCPLANQIVLDGDPFGRAERASIHLPVPNVGINPRHTRSDRYQMMGALQQDHTGPVEAQSRRGPSSARHIGPPTR